MLIQTIGADAFQKGLQLYLTEFAYKNASSKDLWECMTRATAIMSDGIIIEVESIMGKWVKDLGYPLLTVEESAAPHGKTGCACFAVSQKQFLQNGKSTAVAAAGAEHGSAMVKAGTLSESTCCVKVGLSRILSWD